MKKIILSFVLIFGLVTNCYGGTISIDAIVTMDDLTITWINDAKNTVVDALNSIDGTLIRSRTISSDSLTRNADPVLRWNDSFNDFVITGLLPPTSASLSTTTTAGRALIDGYYVEKDATSHAYTASKDTYVDLSSSGVYTYSVVANGAVEPTTTANSIRLAKVVSGATTISSVTDKRVTSINVGNKDDHILKGMNVIVVSPDSYTYGLVTIDAGVCYVGTTRIEKNTKTTLDIDVAADWHDGVADAITTAWWYIGVDTTGNIKWLGANAPDKSDTDGNTGGEKLYWYDSGNTKYYRVIGVVRIGTGIKVSMDYVQIGNTCYYKHIQPINAGNVTSWAELTLVTLVPPVAEEALLLGQHSAAGAIISLRNNQAQDNYLTEYSMEMVDANTSYPFGWLVVTTDVAVSGVDIKTVGGGLATVFVGAYKLKMR